ncbi:MAG: single-stranded DNA-binding protein, partial [Jatrophihabitantaceae bacterium]
LQQRSFETREGEKRTVIEMQVDEVGPSLRYATAKVNRTQRGSAGGGSYGGEAGGGSAPADDPWSSSGPAASGGGFSDEPPF